MDETYAQLRALMLAAAPNMLVRVDGPGSLKLDAPWPHPRDPKLPMYFGEVRYGKAYVGYHLMALYMNPKMTALVPPTLQKRMQGKTCFNFKKPDPALFAELETLTRACNDLFAKPVDFSAMWLTRP